MNTYIDILKSVQEHISNNHNDLLVDNSDTSEQEREKLIKRNIEEYIKTENLKCEKYSVVSELVNDLYNSMCMYDILTPYLTDDKFIMENGIEEVNVNAWNEIFISDKNGTYLLDKTFPSKSHARDFLNTLGSKLNKNINEGTPIFLGEVRKNIRIACVGVPIVDDEVGINASIRIVSLKNFTRDDLISFKTATPEMLDFLETCIYKSVNICFGGSTNSGKTGSLNYLLSTVADNIDKRVVTIEIESREFNFKKFNELGKPTNNVVNWVTRENPDPKYNVDANTLEELGMRFSPMIIGIGEMRNKEALITCEIATTGHTVITTTHSDNAHDTYDRIVMLCKKAGMNYDDNTLYSLAIKAFPIICYQKRMQDRTRKIVEILEGLSYRDGVLKTNSLYKYTIETSSNTLVTGKFENIGKISDKLRNKLRGEGISEDVLKNF